MFARLKLWIAAAFVAVGIVAGAYFSGKVNGRAAINAEAHKQAAEALRKARKIEKASYSDPIADVRGRIANRVRD